VRVRWIGRAVAAAGMPALGSCGGEQSVFDAPSPGASAIEGLWWVSLVSTGFLAALVIGGLIFAIRRAQRAGEDGGRSTGSERPHGVRPPSGSGRPREGEYGYRPDDHEVAREQRFILVAGVAVPILFLVGFLGFSVRTGGEVATPPGEHELVIEVTGHMFWWEVHYPDHDITTANELHIPVGTVVHLEVTSADVIHSFWVPQLSPGKVDMVPGRTNAIWMFAEEPGRFRGQCTEFGGVQHALMSLSVTAHEPGGFEDWVEARRSPPPPPADSLEMQGMAVFFNAGCSSCHAIEGIRPPDPRGMAGPSLSHLASRETLAALTIPNDREHLTAWIVDPHQYKPGVRMPPTRLPSTDLEALVTYLETLQ
jgi:cytochrome c oxidase subunit II